MDQVQHGCATTTAAVRRAIQHSPESLRALAKRYGVNQKTIAKWRKRTSVTDLKTDPSEPRSTALSVEDEAVVFAAGGIRCCRWTTALTRFSRRSASDALANSHEQLRRHLSDFVAAYNFARRLKTLKGLTPYEHICKCWTSEPDRFRLDPNHQMPGLNI